MADGASSRELGEVAALVERAGREVDAAIAYTRRAQQRLLEGQLVGVVHNMNRIVTKLDTDHALIDAQRRHLQSLGCTVASVDGESTPEQIITVLTPALGHIGTALEALRAIDTELIGTQQLTGEVLEGGAPRHIQSQVQRVRDTVAETHQRLQSAKTVVHDTLRAAYQAGTITVAAGRPAPAADTAAPGSASPVSAPSQTTAVDAQRMRLMQAGHGRASQIIDWALAQGWTRSQSAAGPPKFIDANGIVRLTLKKGSPRTPGSQTPHVELRDEYGRRIDPTGNRVTRHSPANHTPIIWDLP